MDYLVLTKTGGMILGPVSQILGVIMDLLFRFTSSMGVLNIGLCIILFTLVVKVLMFPLTIKQQKSSKLMTVMQPELQAIQNKYKGKTDNDSMMKMNVETKAGEYRTNQKDVFTAGDMHRGQSLVVWAIREGREAARAVDQDLMGYTNLN